MKLVFQEFNNRVNEIDIYLTFVKDIDKASSKLSYTDKKKTSADILISDDLKKILRANLFLLLYNLIESSIKKSISAIYENMRNEGISYSVVTPAFKKIWIKNNIKKNIEKMTEENLANGIKDLAEKILKSAVLEFDSEKLPISGNLDARKIEDLAKEYGFSSNVLKKIRKAGEDLLTVKTKRNDLAHGITSFSECGRDYTVKELEKFKKNAVSYVNEILKNIQKFIEKKGYQTP